MAEIFCNLKTPMRNRLLSVEGNAFRKVYSSGTDHYCHTMALTFCCTTVKNEQVAAKFVDILQPTCYQQADIRMRLHDLRQLVDDKSVESCQQTCCKLIVKTCCPQACALLQVVSTSCGKSANYYLQQA